MSDDQIKQAQTELTYRVNRIMDWLRHSDREEWKGHIEDEFNFFIMELADILEETV